MSDKPDLDPETHEDDTVGSVWKRRLALSLLIVLVVAVAAPSFSGCSGFMQDDQLAARFVVDGKTHDVRERDLERFMVRFDATMRFFDPERARGLPDGEEGRRQALQMLMLDAAAKAQGISVADSQIAEILGRQTIFQTGGKFDEARYRSTLSDLSRKQLNHEQLTEMIRVQMRIGEYQQIYGAAFDVLASEEAYENWKKRNVKLTVEYVAVPFESQRASADALVPTDDDLRSVADLPDVKALLRIPPKKTVEIAYMKVEDMTLAQVEAAEKFANEVEIFNEDEPLNDAAFVLFHTKRDHVFTKANWGRLVDPDYVSKKARWDEQHAKRESDPNKAALPAEDPEPKDPAADYPANSREQFPLWRERAIKETLAEKILTRLATRAEREGKSLTEAGAEYARFGVKVVRNDTPLTDEELVDKFPDPIVRDSDFDQTARNRFRAPPEGVVFKPVYVTQPVATTRIGERIRDRGMMVMRLESSDAARQSSPTEKREVVTEFWRKHKVSQLAKAQAEVIRAKADAAGPELDKRSQALRAAAAEMGLEVHTLRRFNNSTTAPKIPVAGPNEKLAPELEASARRVAFRNRVQQHYTFLSVLEPGKIVDQVVLDDRSQAAYAMLLTDKHEPTPLEMRDTDLRQERYGLAQQSMSKMTELTSYDALAKRFSLERFDPQPKKKSEEKKG